MIDKHDYSFDHQKFKIQIMKLISRKFTHETFILQKQQNHLNHDNISMITIFIIKNLKYTKLQKIYRQLTTKTSNPSKHYHICE